MYFLIKNNRIALSSPTKLTDDMIEIDSPVGYCTANQCDWELVEGVLLYHPVQRPASGQTQGERIKALEDQNTKLTEELTATKILLGLEE